VALEIPAGALSGKTTISITPTTDETPLPNLAERVGSQFRIEPEGLALAKPANLTLPVSSSLVTRFGAAGDELKVWVRKDAGWKLTAPIGTPTMNSVAIAVDQLTVAAAGVNLKLNVSPCSTASCIAAVESTTCPSTSPACVQTLAHPSPAPATPEIATDGAAIYYLMHPNATSVAVARIDLSTFVTTISGSLLVDTISTADNINVDSNGLVWAGLGDWGNGRFGFGTNATQSFDVGQRGYGALISGSNVFRLASGGYTFGTSPISISTAWPRVETVLTVPPPGSGLRGGNVTTTPGESAALRTDGTLGFWTTLGDIELFRDSNEQSVFQPTGGVVDGPIVSCPNGSVAASRGTSVLRGTLAGNFVPVAIGDSISDIACDSTNRVWVASANQPRVYVIQQAVVNFEPVTQVKSFDLVPAGASSTTVAGRIPLSLRVLSTTKAVFMGHDRSLYSLTLQ
jgi:hypothetical protein